MKERNTHTSERHTARKEAGAKEHTENEQTQMQVTPPFPPFIGGRQEGNGETTGRDY